ncbi:LysR family transcriptional regulator [Candidatus Pantoea floridensis]|uniref:DNA-binding transcriptional regulator, LysR family n=1 Tax=Candidatus Pantoea floridensis TaxID=1938870 RepID=A0A286DNL7_9GAMM|nr:LysR substrate-binding domain-containing protein [Pantoea floridensis]PIF15159.1 DNA-binding transcriptional LysR family regulator [Enterobacteriaceae bacterium JKS000233]SOD60226.1 DNA-binding transcriptional regulator, LysR family [Pantoea floridensis]
MGKNLASHASEERNAYRIAPGIRFDLVTLRVFVATAELGGITHAAAQLHLVPAAASRRIRELEEQLGMPLFVRLPHGMALNDAGRAILAHARSILHAAERMQDDMQAFLQGNRGVVRIAACTSAVLQFLTDDLRRSHQLYPNIHIDLHEMNSESVIQAVQRGVADIGIYEQSVSHASLPLIPYRHDRLCVVTPIDHPLAEWVASKQLLTANELLQHDLIGLTEGASISIMLTQLARRLDKPLKMRIRVGSFDSMAAMISCGIGIGLMPESVARQIISTSEFAHLSLHDPLAERQFVLCHQAHEAQSMATESILTLLSHVSEATH